MADVFISYSRQRESEFVDRLTAALTERGQEVWVDRSDIFPSSAWRPELEQAILEAHAFVFVISPESVSSEYCLAELDHAISLGKRIVPLLARETAIDTIPPTVAALHFLSFTDFQDPATVDRQRFEQQVDRLVEVLSTDVESLHLHTGLLTRATQWSKNNQDKSLLLRGRELEQAERWLDEQTAQQRPVLPRQQQLIRESRRAAIRRQRGSISAVSVVALAMVLLAVVALLQRGQAVHQSNLALSGDYASESYGVATINVTAQGLLSLEGAARAQTAQTRSALVGAATEPLLHTLHATVGPLNGVAYDPHQGLVATGGKFGVTLWNTATNAMQGHPFDAGHDVNAVAFSADGTVLAAAQQNGRVALFRVSSRSAEGELTADGSAVTGVAFAPTGDEVAGVTGKGGVYVWNLSTHASVHSSAGADTGLLSVAFSPDGSRLAVGGYIDILNGVNGVVNVYTTSLQSPQTYSYSGYAVNHLAFNAGSDMLAAATDNNQVVLLNVANLASKDTIINLPSPVNAVAFSPSANLLATGESGGAVRLWNSSSLHEVGPAMETGSVVYGVAFSPDGHSVAAGGFGGNVLVWSATGRMPGASTLTGPALVQLSLNRDGTLLASADTDGTVDVRSLTHQPSPGLLPIREILTSVAFSPRNATLLAVGEDSGSVDLYDTASHGSKTLPGGGGFVTTTTFSPDGKSLAVGHNNGTVTLWNLQTRKATAHFSIKGAHPGGVLAIAFSPDGQTLATSYENYGIELFHPHTPRQPGQTVTTDENIWSLAYSRDGATLAGGDGQGNVELFDAPDFRHSGTLTGDGSVVYALAITSSGTLTTMDHAGNFRLWDLATGQQLGTPVGTGSAGYGLALAANGSDLATGNANGSIILWPSLLWSTDAHAFRSDLCPRLGQNLTAQQWRQYGAGQPYDRTCAQYPSGT
jgi:WD40 repeat protein